jgi:hypothetical protein
LGGRFSAVLGWLIMTGRKREVQLSAQEHEVLRAIAKSLSPPPAVSSTQRLRFEMLGLIEDRANGVCLTERGREVAQAPVHITPASPAVEEAHRRASRDKRGRRLGHQRQSPF